MIIVTRRGVTESEIDHIRERVESLGFRTHISRGETRVVIGCIGDEVRLQEVPLLSIPGVETVHPVMMPYKLAAREFTADHTRIPFGGAEVGGPEVVVIAGPCAVESEGQILDILKSYRNVEAVPRDAWRRVSHLIRKLQSTRELQPKEPPGSTYRRSSAVTAWRSPV